MVNKSEMHELLYQALETEIGGQGIYEAAVGAAVNGDLREEWSKYLDEARTHEQILRGLFAELGVDADTDSPGRHIVRRKAQSVSAAERVPVECVAQAGEQEAEHLFHTMGWARELWIQALGLPTVLPPPEEQKHVVTQIGAGRAEKAREEMLTG